MEYIRSLPYELRLDWCLFQYSARSHHIVDYRTQHIKTASGRIMYRSDLEHCPECALLAPSLNRLTNHYMTLDHITRVANVIEEECREYTNTMRHDALRYIVKAYKNKSKQPVLSTASVGAVLRAIGDDIEYNAYQLLRPQLEALVSVLERHTPDLFQKRQHFWAMALLGSVRD